MTNEFNPNDDTKDTKEPDWFAPTADEVDADRIAEDDLPMSDELTKSYSDLLMF